MSHYLFIKDLPVSLQKPNDLPVPSWHISLSQWQMAPRGHQASHVPPRRGENHGDRDDQGAIWWWLTGWWDVSTISVAISVGIRWITWQRWQRTNKEMDLRFPYFPVAMGSMQNPGEHGSIPRWKRREPKHLYDSTCNVRNKWKPMKHLKMANWEKLYQTLPDFKTTKELPVCRETDSALWRQPKIWWYAKVMVAPSTLLLMVSTCVMQTPKLFCKLDLGVHSVCVGLGIICKTLKLYTCGKKLGVVSSCEVFFCQSSEHGVFPIENLCKPPLVVGVKTLTLAMAMMSVLW